MEGDSAFSEFLENAREENLNSSSASSTLFGGNICVGELEEVEETPEVQAPGNSEQISLEEVSDEEYQEYIEELMEDLETPYEDLPPEIVEKIAELKETESGATEFDSVDDYLAAVEKVKSCIASCDGLRRDQKAVCATMCTCGQWDSPLFDPYKTPGLGPIMRVKVCEIPAASKNFEGGGIIVYSLEKIFSELFAILDSLDRSGELGVFEKQEGFLDSSTKKMKFSEMITFTFGQSVKRNPELAKQSVHFREAVLKNDNASLKQELGVSHPLENPMTVNSYVLIQNRNDITLANTFSAQVRFDDELKKVRELQQMPSRLADMELIARTNRYIDL